MAAGRGIDGPNFHSRHVYVLLLSARAGVFAGLDSKKNLQPYATHPPMASGFFVFAGIDYGSHYRS
jgi:hypothetical protein